MLEVDEYVKRVIERGDEGSDLLAKITAPTLKNSEFVDIIQGGMGGIAVLRIPEDCYVVVHSMGGGPNKTALDSYTASMVDRLVNKAKLYRRQFNPVGLADVIDANEGERSDIETIANALVSKADEYEIPILNGELAILGERVNCVANIMGTMISLVEKGDKLCPGTFIHNEVRYAVFDPEGRAVYINSDGVGTKTDFYERAKKYKFAVNDFMAMNLDDASKIGAEVKVISGVVETKGEIPIDLIKDHADELARSMGFLAILQEEEVGDRIRGYNDSAASYNLSGSVISTIDEERLRNPLKPSAGEYIIAIRGEPNPRSNGITDKRKMMINLLGEDWHNIPEGKLFLEYLTEPSTILYPVFKKLIDEGIATSVYHMSGGAYNGKLARPLAKHDLFVELENLFLPDYRELALAGAGFTPAEVAYTKWPMGNDGFITTKDSNKAIDIIESQGLEARVVGQLERSERTGVKLTAVNRERVYFSGK